MGRDKRASRQALSQLEAPGSSQANAPAATRSSTSSASQRSTAVTSTSSSSSQPSRGRGSASRGRGRGRIANRQTLQESESDEKSSESDEEEEQTPARKTGRGRGAAAGSKRNKNLKGFVVSDDDEEFSTTVGKSQAKNPKNGVGNEENTKENLVNNVLVYILSKQNQMAGFPRSEIVRDVMGKQNRSKFKEVIGQVQFILKETFLMKLIGLEDMKAVGSSAETFLLINTVPSEVLEDSANIEFDKPISFLYVVLTMIYMEGAPLDADRLWSSLVKLEMHDDLCPERENFEKFLKEEYLKKHYLDLKNYTQTGEGTRKSTYEWGIRAHYEFCKMTMLRDVAKRMNVRDIKSFTYAYAEARKQMQVYGTVCRAAYVDRGGDQSTYSTTTDDDNSSNRGQTSQNTSQDVSQLETQSLDEF